MQFFGHFLQPSRNSVALNITLNWSTPENTSVLVRFGFISALLLIYHKQLVHQLTYSYSCAHQAVKISHFSSFFSFPVSRCISEGDPWIPQCSMWLQVRWPIPGRQDLSLVFLASIFLPALLSWECLSGALQRSGSYFRLECFYLIHEQSCGHLLTDQKKREMLERMCQVQPCWMPGSSAAAECVFHIRECPGFV